MTDPMGSAADTIENAGSGIKNTIKKTYNGVSRVVTPVITAYGFLSAYSLLDGGVGALASTGIEGASRMDMIKVPLEGFTELTEDISEIAQSLTGYGSELAESPTLN